MRLFGILERLTQLILRSGANTSTINPASGADPVVTVPSESGTLVGETATQTLTNKTVVAANNTITTAASGNLTSTELDAALSELQTDIDTRATDADLTTHTGASSGVHGATGSIVGTTDTQTLQNKTIVAASNTITTAASGNLTSTELNAALAELQTDVDTRATDADLTSHTGASSGVHGVTGSVVGTSDAQTLTSKTIDADNNTISNLAHGAEVDNPSSGVHGVTGSVVGTSDSQVLTNKDIDGGTASNTSRITVPKASSATLAGLTRKEATVVYDTTLGKFLGDDGSALQALGGGLEPTAIDHTDLPLTAESGKMYLVDMSGASADETLTLPNISTQLETIGVQVVSAHADHGLIVAADASDTIDGATQHTLRNESDWRIYNAQSSTNWAAMRASSGNGTIVTEWKSYTPTYTGFGSPSGIVAQWRRVGDTMEIQHYCASGAPTATEGRVSLPSGYTIGSTVGTIQTVGSYFTSKGTATNKGGGVFIEPSVTYLTFGAFGTFGTTAVAGLAKANGDAIMENGDPLSFTAIAIPIAEWQNSGTTVTLNDLTARTKWVDESVCSVSNSNGGSVTDAEFQAYRDSAGTYSLKYRIAITGASSSATHVVTLGGVSFRGVNSGAQSSITTGGRVFTGGTSTVTQDTDTATTYVQISGEAILSAKPSWFDANVENSQSIDAQVPEATATEAGIVRPIGFKLNLSAAENITNSVNVIQNFTDSAETSSFDDDSLWDGNSLEITSDSAGLWYLKAQIGIPSPGAANDTIEVNIRRGGSENLFSAQIPPHSTSERHMIQTDGVVRLSAGDSIAVTAYSDTPSVAIDTGAFTVFTGYRIGK